ncbi:MAG TPA: hypothetical protein VIZ43_00295 [Trebonia sp.]
MPYRPNLCRAALLAHGLHLSAPLAIALSVAMTALRVYMRHGRGNGGGR